MAQALLGNLFSNPSQQPNAFLNYQPQTSSANTRNVRGELEKALVYQ
jgi:hypothetical protein